MPFADTHCHLDFPVFEQTRSELLRACQRAAIELLVVPATERSSWANIVSLTREHPQVRAALGLHPYFIAVHQERELHQLAQQVEQNRTVVCAIGEIGLDATVGEFDRQVFFFEQQLAIAEQTKLPAIIHSRKTHNQVAKRLKRVCLPGAVIHAFSGSQEEAESLLAVGASFGVGGVITWPRATKTRQVISRLPLDSLVLETDAPDMTIQGGVKGGGSPLNVQRVFEVLAELRSEQPDILAEALWQNSQRLFLKASTVSSVEKNFS